MNDDERIRLLEAVKTVNRAYWKLAMQDDLIHMKIKWDGTLGVYLETSALEARD